MCLIASQERSKLSKFVKCTTLLATFVVFTLAVSHVVYLFEAFEAKDGIESLLQSGSELYTHEKFLWYLLYSFGEADQLQDLRQVKFQRASIQNGFHHKKTWIELLSKYHFAISWVIPETKSSSFCEDFMLQGNSWLSGHQTDLSVFSKVHHRITKVYFFLILILKQLFRFHFLNYLTMIANEWVSPLPILFDGPVAHHWLTRWLRAVERVEKFIIEEFLWNNESVANATLDFERSQQHITCSWVAVYIAHTYVRTVRMYTLVACMQIKFVPCWINPCTWFSCLNKLRSHAVWELHPENGLNAELWAICWKKAECFNEKGKNRDGIFQVIHIRC